MFRGMAFRGSAILAITLAATRARRRLAEVTQKCLVELTIAGNRIGNTSERVRGRLCSFTLEVHGVGRGSW